MGKTISLEDALQKKTQTEVCDNTERVVLSYTDTEGQSGIKTVPVSYFDKTIKKAMFVSLLNDITTNAAHSIYFTEKTTALTVGSTVTLTIDNIKEYIHTSDWYYTLPGDVVDSFFTLFTTNYFLFYNKTGDEYVDEFIKTSGIYNYSLDDISDETIEAFKKCEYGAISADFRKLSIVTCPIGEFALQRDSFKEYSFKISNNSNVVLTVGSVEKSCTIQELIL